MAITEAMRRHDTILLTGFGPFPGVVDNASQRFVPKLAHLAARRFSAHRVVARILPTEWERAPQRLEDLYERERPKLVLQFGVSPNADSYVIETLARNARRPAEDASGALPRDSAVLRGGPETLAARLPAVDIQNRLHALSVPAVTSDNAGSYLCNAILYRSLICAEQISEPEAVGFFHIPQVIPPALLKAHVDPNTMRFDWGTALIGGLEIIRTCLGRPPPSRRRVKDR
ncbi:pyroglutamyl-peptidase I [Hyphomicrobium sp.]|uniref:pyroglutamyl-peptidase I family protein n=1 Tax=Hyphomicrobium sp. TaxID=82 RepID=UPI0025C45E77|nr:pyroglutamyl-peptidase I [Hyphomicrobium sp.]MCC7252979.1 pyroglutamyl-peptidase I [Hyphomicrobium sp.]